VHSSGKVLHGGWKRLPAPLPRTMQRLRASLPRHAIGFYLVSFSSPLFDVIDDGDCQCRHIRTNPPRTIEQHG
jgi:hypothetical protein